MARTTRGIATARLDHRRGLAAMARGDGPDTRGGPDVPTSALNCEYRDQPARDPAQMQLLDHGAGPAGAEDDRRPEEGACGDLERRRSEVPADASAPANDREVPGRPRRHHQGGRGGDPGEPEAGAARTPGPDPAPGRWAARLRPPERGRDRLTPGPTFAERLKLSDDQVRRIRAIVEEGEPEIKAAATFPIPMDPNDPLPTEASGPQAGGKPGIPGGQAESPPGRPRSPRPRDPSHRGRGPDRAQRAAYHKLLGAPFDLSRLHRGAGTAEEPISDEVAAALGLGGGQRADPDFNTKVAHPAYAGGPDIPASSSTRPTTTSTPPPADTSRSPT